MISQPIFPSLSFDDPIHILENTFTHSTFYIIVTLSLPVCEQLKRWHYVLVAYLGSLLLFRIAPYRRDSECLLNLMEWEG